MLTKQSFFIPQPQSPCLDCKDRFFDGERTCHGSCEKYKAYKAKLDRVNEEIRNAEIADNVCVELSMKRYCRQNRKKPKER